MHAYRGLHSLAVNPAPHTYYWPMCLGEKCKQCATCLNLSIVWSHWYTVRAVIPELGQRQQAMTWLNYSGLCTKWFTFCRGRTAVPLCAKLVFLRRTTHVVQNSSIMRPNSSTTCYNYWGPCLTTWLKRVFCFIETVTFGSTKAAIAWAAAVNRLYGRNRWRVLYLRAALSTQRDCENISPWRVFLQRFVELGDIGSKIVSCQRSRNITICCYHCYALAVKLCALLFEGTVH